MIKKRSWLISNPLPDSSTSCNKDLNGGYGTWDKIGENLISKLIARAKKSNIKLPVLCLGYIQKIIESNDIQCFYTESYDESIKIIENKEIEGVVIYGSIVACDLENKLIKEIKSLSNTKVIIVGTYPSKFPDRFEEAHHIICGEPEDFFMKWRGTLAEINENSKIIKSDNLVDLDQLPLPKYTTKYSKKFSYRPMLKYPTGFIEATRGCPYSCGYYCTYGENQGKIIRTHSVKALIEIMKELKKIYGFKSFQFRDPVFGLKKDFLEDFCLEMIKSELAIEWGMETRIDLLNKSLLRLMSKSGLKSINIGIETPDEKIAAANKRKVCSSDKQKELINFAFKEGIRINAFYIIGLEDDDMQSCLNTINYSLSLKTYMARFAVCTPYPGTEYYSDLNKNDRIENKKFSSFNQQELVYKHKNLSHKEVKYLIQKAYLKYYLRPKIILKIIKQRFSK